METTKYLKHTCWVFCRAQCYFFPNPKHKTPFCVFVAFAIRIFQSGRMALARNSHLATRNTFPVTRNPISSKNQLHNDVLSAVVT